MKRFQQILGVGGCLGLLLVTPLARGQDAPGTTQLPAAATPQNNAAALAARQEAEENYNFLKGHIDDLLAAQADQQKQIQELRRQVEELRQIISKPNSGSVSQDDFKQLAATVQEIDRKREADKELILKEMEKLGHIVTEQPPQHTPRNTGSRTSPSEGGSGSTTSAPPPNQSGYYYTIKKDETISLIAQACREQGIKVTTRQILEANPNLNPSKLYVGMKIFIPDGKKSP